MAMKNPPVHHGFDRSRIEAESQLDGVSELIPTTWMPGRRQLASWAVGLLVLAAVVIGVLHYSSIERFVELARGSRPQWLLLCIVTQMLTYACVTTVWRQ